MIIVTTSVVFKKPRFQNVFRPTRRRKTAAFSNSYGLKSVFEKLRFRDGLAWTVGLTVEAKCVSKFLLSSVDDALH